MVKAFNLSKFNKLKHIAISEHNYKEIQKYGKFGDSFDNVITRILSSIQHQLKEDSGKQKLGGI